MANLVSPYNVSNYLLNSSRESGEILTNLKLQKLLYYCQAWHLALKDAPIFEDDFQAWVHGPVLPSQYDRFSSYRWRPIDCAVADAPITNDVRSHIDEVLEVFGSETAIALEQMTHDEMPWKRARGALPAHEPSREIIQKDWMRDYYRSLIKWEK